MSEEYELEDGFMKTSPRSTVPQDPHPITWTGQMLIKQMDVRN
jgi:hypothetical protein